MLRLDIQQFSSDNKSLSAIKMDINNGSYIGITGKKYNQLMYALIGKEDFVGDVALDEYSIKKNYDEYMEQVAYISSVTRKRLNGQKLTIDEFLDLSVMMRMEKIDIIQYENKKNKYLQFFGINSNRRLCELEESELLLIEFITLFLKSPRLILIDDFLSLLSENQVNKMMDFLKKYLHPNNISVIASKYEDFLIKFTDQIYVLE